ncbi:CD248 molecule, endosialin a [Alosa sapidissima]|uniref:CD248 molecule, endosialin a n=1 Tax=Alosa sapidissima TaxID=34773 RepID=UPI001C09D9C9|nr:CD248 molecule, endosialin a [Alosa sapidissima]
MSWTAEWPQRGGGLPLLWLLGVSLLLLLTVVSGQELREGDAVCTEDRSCFVLYFQRKTFLYAWRSCKERGGDLATLKEPGDAAAVERLFAGADLRRGAGQQQSGKLVRAWIGLQRQPRQCSANRPLRGFSWVTGDQETRFTNWQAEDSASACTSPRCVVVGYAEPSNPDNLKWSDGPCSITVDAYLCKYNYKGMCPSIPGEGGGNTFYSTPFDLLTTDLSYLPFGSVATLPCPVDTVGDQTILCTDMSDGSVNWSREAPYCSPKQSWCDQDNGGCHQLCIDKEDMHVCMCIEGYALAEDGMSCLPDDPCHDAPCESECVPVPDGGGFRCDCPEGYVLEPDERSCRDLDECQQMPCAHECVNSPGSYECRCLDGYRAVEAGECDDVDECDDGDGDGDGPCEHACENTLGSYVCHCHLGFAPTPEDPSHCRDIDECQIEQTCEQMCINYDGGFECYCQEGYELQDDHYSCRPVTDGPHGDTTAATPAAPYPWAPVLNDSMWTLPWEPRPDQAYDPDPTDYQDNTHWTVDHGAEWPPQRPLVPSPLPEEPYYRPESHTESLGDYDSFESPEPSTQFPPLVVEVLDPTPVPDLEPPTPSPTARDDTTPDWYDEGEDDHYGLTTTTGAPTTTIIEGAWNWHWTPEEEEIALGIRPLKPSPTPTPTEGAVPEDTTPTSSSPASGVDVQGLPSEGQPGEESSSAGEGEEEEEEEEGGSSWLLVGLLVPFCIFLLVMVVLGAIYCNRVSASSKPQNKNSSDCYHWISGAADKAGTEHSGSATKSHV